MARQRAHVDDQVVERRQPDTWLPPRPTAQRTCVRSSKWNSPAANWPNARPSSGKDVRQVAERAEVHAQQRHRAVADGAHGPEHRPVTSEGHHDVAGRDQIRFRQHVHTGDRRRRRQFLGRQQPQAVLAARRRGCRHRGTDVRFGRVAQKPDRDGCPFAGAGRHEALPPAGPPGGRRPRALPRSAPRSARPAKPDPAPCPPAVPRAWRVPGTRPGCRCTRRAADAARRAPTPTPVRRPRSRRRRCSPPA